MNQVMLLCDSKMMILSLNLSLSETSCKNRSHPINQFLTLFNYEFSDYYKQYLGFDKDSGVALTEEDTTDI